MPIHQIKTFHGNIPVVGENISWLKDGISGQNSRKNVYHTHRSFLTCGFSNRDWGTATVTDNLMGKALTEGVERNSYLGLLHHNYASRIKASALLEGCVSTTLLHALWIGHDLFFCLSFVSKSLWMLPQRMKGKSLKILRFSRRAVSCTDPVLSPPLSRTCHWGYLLIFQAHHQHKAKGLLGTVRIHRKTASMAADIGVYFCDDSSGNKGKYNKSILYRSKTCQTPQ